MDARSFFDLVAEARNARHRYDDTKEYYWMEKAIELESKVDAEIERVQNILRLQNRAKELLKPIELTTKKT